VENTIGLVDYFGNRNLQLVCNEFKGTSNVLTHWLHNGEIDNQGTPTLPAANRFLGTKTLDDVYTDAYPETNSFKYYYNDPSGSAYTPDELQPNLYDPGSITITNVAVSGVPLLATTCPAAERFQTSIPYTTNGPFPLKDFLPVDTFKWIFVLDTLNHFVADSLFEKLIPCMESYPNDSVIKQWLVQEYLVRGQFKKAESLLATFYVNTPKDTLDFKFLTWIKDKEKNNNRLDSLSKNDSILLSHVILDSSTYAFNAMALLHFNQIKEFILPIPAISKKGDKRLMNPNNAKDLFFTVYPNPANDNVCFNVDDKYIGGRLLIYDLLGNIVMSQALQGSKVNLNVQGLSSGTYLFSINGFENTDGTKKGKFTISH